VRNKTRNKECGGVVDIDRDADGLFSGFHGTVANSERCATAPTDH
jgi:hypothetical protein